MGFSITSDQLASKSQSPVTSSLPLLISQDYHLCNLHSPANVTVCCFSSTPRTFLPPCLCGCSFYCLWCLFCPFFPTSTYPFLCIQGSPIQQLRPSQNLSTCPSVRGIYPAIIVIVGTLSQYLFIYFFVLLCTSYVVR